MHALIKWNAHEIIFRLVLHKITNCHASFPSKSVNLRNHDAGHHKRMTSVRQILTARVKLSDFKHQCVELKQWRKGMASVGSS